MSRTALNELLVATPSKFRSMLKKIPDSEKKEILEAFQKRSSILGSFL